MKTSRMRPGLSLVGLAAIGLLAACGSGGVEATPTPAVEQIETRAVATFAAGLTATAQALPTGTPTATETPAPTATSTPAITSTAAASPTSLAPTSSCYGLVFVADVTIPDNTKMDPGESFTKTWRVRNSGSCRWENDFLFNFTGGEAMGGTAYAIGDIVDPGEEIELSVDLKAPDAPGTYRGNWRMSTAAKVYFGDEVYVQIIVGDVPTATASPTTAP